MVAVSSLYLEEKLGDRSCLATDSVLLHYRWNPYQLSSMGIDVPVGHVLVPAVSGLSVGYQRPPQDRTMFFPLPQSYIALTLILEAWLGLCPLLNITVQNRSVICIWKTNLLENVSQY